MTGVTTGLPPERSAPAGMLRGLNTPFVWLAVFLAGMEFAAMRWVPYVHAPVAGDVPSNAFRMRGWPEYLSGERPADRKLVIVIGNSQGYGREIAADKIFTSLLQQRFDADGLNVRVENWCMPGATMIDHELAMLRASEKKPDVLVFMKTFEDFVLSDKQHNLNYVGMDIDILAGSPFFWRQLSRMSLGMNLTLDSFLKRALMKNSRLVRSRVHALDLIAGILADDEIFALLFGHMREREAFAVAMPEKGFPSLMEKRARGEAAIVPKEVKAKMRGLPFFLRLLPAFINDLTTSLEGGSTKVIWCWNPVIADFLKADQLRTYSSCCRKADEMLRNAGIEPLDLKDLVPVEHYYTYSHFDEEGHRIVADRLEPLITNALQ